MARLLRKRLASLFLYLEMRAQPAASAPQLRRGDFFLIRHDSAIK